MRLFASVRAHSDLISAIGIEPSALHQTLIEAQATHRVRRRTIIDRHDLEIHSCPHAGSFMGTTSRRQLSASSEEGQSAKRSEWKRMSNQAQGLPGHLSPEDSTRSVPHDSGPPIWLRPIGSS